jgi:hypothetical protein
MDISTVKSYMKQLKNIMGDIDTVNAKKRELETKKRELEKKVHIYLKQRDEQAIKYEDIIIFSKNKAVREKLKKSVKDKSIREALVNAGIGDPTEILKIIADASKGDEVFQEKVHIKKI